MTRVRAILMVLVPLVFGVILGGYLFSDSRPRSFLALNNCQDTCLKPNKLLGLAASVGLQKFSGLLPSVVKETDKTIVLDSASAPGSIHYVIVPKKDIKNVGELSDADSAYLVDAYKVAGELIREKNLKDYTLVTNGPGYQTVTYLHFHLMGR